MRDKLEKLSYALTVIDDIPDGTFPARFDARLREIRNDLATLENDLSDAIEGPSHTPPSKLQ